MKATLPYRVGEPPARLKRARLDNIALVPASLLPLKGTYQPLVNSLPKGTILLVQTASPRQKKILEKVVTFFRKHGRQVITLPVERITRNIHRKKRTREQNLKLAF